MTDTGTGIREEDLPKLFHMYQVLDEPAQMHSSGTSPSLLSFLSLFLSVYINICIYITVTVSAGTGLGLVIARNFVYLLGGEITVTSEFGKGSTFSFWFPCQPVDSITAEKVA